VRGKGLGVTPAQREPSVTRSGCLLPGRDRTTTVAGVPPVR